VSQHEQWQISGNAPEVYERYLVPTLFTPWATDLIARLPLHAGEHVLDVAWGRAASHASRHTASALAAQSRAWISTRICSPWHARSRTFRACEWTGGKAVRWPFPLPTPCSMSCSVSRGLQFFPDRSPPYGKCTGSSCREDGSGSVCGVRCSIIIRSLADGYGHSVGTCRMGPSPEAGDVVDHDGMVYGTENVFVSDASIVPDIPQANTNLTCMLIGRKLAGVVPLIGQRAAPRSTFRPRPHARHPPGALIGAPSCRAAVARPLQSVRAKRTCAFCRRSRRERGPLPSVSIEHYAPGLK
jgi:hypothetical protein